MSENKFTVNGTTTIKRHKIIILKRREIVCTLKLCVIFVDHWHKLFRPITKRSD